MSMRVRSGRHKGAWGGWAFLFMMVIAVMVTIETGGQDSAAGGRRAEGTAQHSPPLGTKANHYAFIRDHICN